MASGRKRRIASTKLGWGEVFSARMEEGSWVGGTLEALSRSLRLQNHQVPTLILDTGFAGRYSHYSDLSESPSFLLYKFILEILSHADMCGSERPPGSPHRT